MGLKHNDNRTNSNFFLQEWIHYRRIKCLSCEKLGGHLENCDLKHLLPVKLLFSNEDCNESYPLAVVTNAQTEITNTYGPEGKLQTPNHPWMLLPRGYKWDRKGHHYVWVLNEGEVEGGPFMGEQMTVQMDFFAEQAAKELVDKWVLRELELNNEVAAWLQQAREVLVREQEAVHAATENSGGDNNSLSSPATVQCSADSGRIEPQLSQQISNCIDQLLNEVRRERVERTQAGRRQLPTNVGHAESRDQGTETEGHGVGEGKRERQEWV